MGNPNRFNQFRAEIATNRLAPATSNLWEFRLPPPVFMASQFGRFNSDIRETVSNINYFANSVTVPSRAVTTGEVNNFGMIRRFATGQTNSSINVSFLVTKDQSHRAFFEKWMHYCASDSDNTVGFYDDYVTDMTVVKWESGANFRIINDNNDQKDKEHRGALNPMQASAVYQIYGAFPVNVSTMTLDNEQTSLLIMEVEFYFERYRMDPVASKTLKYRQKQPAFTWQEVRLRVEGSGNPDVQRYSV